MLTHKKGPLICKASPKGNTVRKKRRGLPTPLLGDWYHSKNLSHLSLKVLNSEAECVIHDFFCILEYFQQVDPWNITFQCNFMWQMLSWSAVLYYEGGMRVFPLFNGLVSLKSNWKNSNDFSPLCFCWKCSGLKRSALVEPVQLLSLKS